MKVHLLDGTYELFRSFYGPPPKQAPDGREVGATVYLMKNLMALLDDPQVTHLACAFDHEITPSATTCMMATKPVRAWTRCCWPSLSWPKKL